MIAIEQREATQKLRDGAVLIAALDDMLALICDARSDEAVLLMRKLKQRAADKGFSVLMDSDARINRYIPDVPALAWDIFDSSADSPVILILPKAQQLSKHVLAADGSVAVRKITNLDEQKLVQTANSPLACTALLDAQGKPANSIEAADPAVLDALEYVLSLPTAKKHYPPSTIPVIRLEMDGEVKIIRG
jgi:L-threonylcarbamoyladenylate synthase